LGHSVVALVQCHNEQIWIRTMQRRQRTNVTVPTQPLKTRQHLQQKHHQQYSVQV